MHVSQWLNWVQRLQGIAQSGLAYDPQPFDRERYLALQQITAEMAAVPAEVDAETVRAVFDAQEGHATPKVDVRGVVFRDGQILLVQEKMDNYRWTLPGGWADPGEPPSAAVEREIWEESGYRAKAVKVLAIYDRNKQGHPPAVFHAYKLFFLCEINGDARRIDDTNFETAGVGFFAPDALPELSLGRVTPSQIARFFEHLHHPELPTDFD